MPQEILDLLARLSELSDSELDDLESSLVEEFDRVDGESKTGENVALLDEIAASVETVRTTKTERQAAADENEQKAADLRARVHAESGDDAAEGEDGDDATGDDTADGDDDEDGEDADAATGDDAEGDDAGEGDEPVATRKAAASTKGAALSSKKKRAAPPARPSMAEMNAARPGGNRPSARRSGAPAENIRARFMARRPGPGIAVGDDLTDRSQLAALEADLVRRLVSSAGTGEMMPVYGVEYAYPERYDLRSPGGKGNLGPEDVKRKMDDTIPQSLVASGGICAPLDVDYTVPVFGVNDEPVYDSLPKYQANRGGLRFIQPPTLASTSASGFTVWSEGTDANPGTATKARQSIVCAGEVEVYVDALVTRVLIGNMMARFSPEIIDANQSLIQVKHAQQRELYLLNKINAASTLVSSGKLLGAARDLLGTLDLITAAYRWRSRLSRNTTLRTIFPEWTIDMFRADLLREMAHGQDIEDSFSLTDAQVEAMLRARNIVVTWAIDGVAANGPGGYGYQGFGAQTAGAAAVDWPQQISWNIFAEGSFQVIDGGELNVGVVRDSTLNNTNDYEQFEEVFRNLAFRGQEALQVVSTVRPNGLSAGTVNTSTY